MSRPHAPKVCGTCSRPLDFLGSDDPDDPGRYVHSNEEYGTRTHVPHPVDYSEVQSIKPVCDFCFASIEAGSDDDWTVVTRPFLMRIADDLTQNYSSLWACCGECANLIRRKRWASLVRRVVKESDRRNPVGRAGRSARKQGLTALFTLVEVNFVALRRGEASDYTGGEFFAPEGEGQQ